VEPDAVTVITVGTVLWAVGLVVALLLHGRLADHGNGDWVWITVAGVVLGLMGIRIVRRRRARLRDPGREDVRRDEPVA
jgi:MFS family permease